MSTAVGIDFGTTNSVVACYSGGDVDVLPIAGPPGEWAMLGFDKVLPSVLGVIDGRRVTFGWDAKTQARDKLEAVKRLLAAEETVTIGGLELSVELAAATLFGQIRAGAESTGVTADRAVVTIPANSRGVARARTKICAGLAGIEVPALINEPTAAAMAHSLSAADDQTILVFDWGGGTLDVTILETVAGVFMERAAKGIQRLGGIDLDDLLVAALRPRVAGHDRWDEADQGHFRLDVEKAKIELSTRPETTIERPPGDAPPLPVTRRELEVAIRDRIEETRRPIEQCLRDIRIDASAIDHLVLVGGTSKIPAVRDFVSEVVGREPSDGADPMTAVAEGAAIAAAILANQLDADVFVGTEHALGTIALDEHQVTSFSTIIPRNHSLPARGSQPYTPANDHQEAVNIRVIEGDPDVALDHEDNVVLQEWSVPVDKSCTREDAAFEITYEYDVDGILHVEAVDLKTRAELLRDEVSFGATKDKAGLVRTATQLRQILETGLLAGNGVTTSTAAPARSLAPEAVALVERIRTKVAPFVDDSEAERLEALCVEVEVTRGAGADAALEALATESRQYAYLF